MTDHKPVLLRLAEALCVPVEAFNQVGDVLDEQSVNLRETAELLDAWARIDDRQTRLRCLSYVKSTAERTGGR